MVEKIFLDKILSEFVDLIYSPSKKNVRILFVLLVVGFILRLVAALNLNVTADDMVYASQIPGIIDSGILSTHSNPPLFFYLSDLAHKIFGYTTFASRFWPLLAGTFLILVIFLITERMFNEQVALVAAFFVTFSNFLVRMTYTEQSLILFFFTFLAIHLGIFYWDSGKIRFIILSGIVFGLALLTKYNAPFFIFSFLIFSTYLAREKSHGKIFTKKNVKHLILFLIIILFFASPFLSFNNLIYKNKGIVDVYFSRVIHVEKAQEIYGGLAGQENSFFDNLIKPSNYGNYNLIYMSDPIIFLFSLIGLGIIIKRKNKSAFYFFLIFLIPAFVLQSAGSPLPKHFAFIHLLFSIPAGYGLYELFKTPLLNKKGVKIGALIILGAIMIFSLGNQYGTPSSYSTRSETSRLKSFINNDIDENDLIVFDSRIYTARSFWLATNHHFLTLEQFPQFYNFHSNLSSNQLAPVDVYVIECVVDDCGWGWIATNPQLNQSSESLIEAVANVSTVLEPIYSKDYSPDENEFFSKAASTKKYRCIKWC